MLIATAIQLPVDTNATRHEFSDRIDQADASQQPKLGNVWFRCIRYCRSLSGGLSSPAPRCGPSILFPRRPDLRLCILDRPSRTEALQRCTPKDDKAQQLSALCNSAPRGILLVTFILRMMYQGPRLCYMRAAVRIGAAYMQTIAPGGFA